MEEIIKKIKIFFNEEDKILTKAMDKVTYLMISRGINQNEERGELIDLRTKLIKELEDEE